LKGGEQCKEVQKSINLRRWSWYKQYWIQFTIAKKLFFQSRSHFFGVQKYVWWQLLYYI